MMTNGTTAYRMIHRSAKTYSIRRQKHIDSISCAFPTDYFITLHHHYIREEHYDYVIQ